MMSCEFVIFAFLCTLSELYTVYNISFCYRFQVQTVLEVETLKYLELKYTCPITLQMLRTMFAQTFDKVLNAKQKKRESDWWQYFTLIRHIPLTSPWFCNAVKNRPDNVFIRHSIVMITNFCFILQFTSIFNSLLIWILWTRRNVLTHTKCDWKS
jgi:hypothetical protein